MWMEMNSSLLMYATDCNLTALSLAFLTVMSFPQLLRCETDMAESYRAVYTFLTCLGSYKYCYTQILKVLYKCCNTDMLKVLLIKLP